jgi:magnesium chelatase family protein
MPFATAHTVSLHGAVGHLIDVQTDVSPGQVGVTMVGRADTTINEARDRCRMAIVNSGMEWPGTRRITILLSPADLLKHGTHFDLSVAVSVLAAAGSIPAEALTATAFIGELTLDGNLRSVAGVLPMVLAAAERGIRAVFVPEPQAAEAQMVPDMSVVGVRSLSQVVAVLRHDDELPYAPPVAPDSGAQLLAWRGQERLEELDLADLIGIADARYAVEVAAAGGHHLLLSGPKGCGKTSLVERVPGILPDLTREESLELSAIQSLAGTLDPVGGFPTRPPFSAPHHDASKASLIGGGLGVVRPGEVSKAHTGVLFLDEFPLFRSDVIEALRQPLENGDVTIARRDESVTLPARGMVVLAANPCPCGDYSADVRENRCSCRESQRRDYRSKITGPVADRVDVVRHLPPLRQHERSADLESPESSAAVRRRVEAARARQAERYDGESWRLNAHAPGPVLRERWPLTKAGQHAVDTQLYDGKLSRRGATRVHRLAWTVTDLRALDRPGLDEVDTALRLRTGEPLLLSMLERAG